MLHFCANLKYETKYAVQMWKKKKKGKCGICGIVLAKIGSLSTNSTCKNNSWLEFNHISKSLTEVHVRCKMWFDSENEAFNAIGLFM
jgi:hypothetical protein